MQFMHRKPNAIYVQYGCGFSVGKDWINFDSSPTLRLERTPVLGRLLGRMAGNSQRFPRKVRYGDIRKGLPFKPNSVRGVYASHILEHLSLSDFKLALRNTFEMLEPGGLFRLIVPDLQARAERYVEEVRSGASEANSGFMRAAHLGLEDQPRSVIGRLRLVLGGSAHLWMWDEPSMREQLRLAGFTNIRRCDFGDSNDLMFSQVEELSRFIDKDAGFRELAMSAEKPR